MDKGPVLRDEKYFPAIIFFCLLGVNQLKFWPASTKLRANSVLHIFRGPYTV
jgi:hypothetical protein